MEVGFLEAYRGILEKVKKRFLRRANHAEAAESLSVLLQRMLRRNRAAQYAAFCAVAVARAHKALRAHARRAYYYTVAADALAQAAVEGAHALALSHGEVVQAVQACYSLAAEAYMEAKKPYFAVCMYTELAFTLQALDLPHEAMMFFGRAAALERAHGAVTTFALLEEQADSALLEGNFQAATAVLREALECGDAFAQSWDWPAATAASFRCHVTLVLVLTHLRDFRQARDLLQTMSEHSTGTAMPEMLLEFINACEDVDSDTAAQVQEDMWPHLTHSQFDLVCRIGRVTLTQ